MANTAPPGQAAALTQLYACRTQLISAHTSALAAADTLANPHRDRANDLADRIGLAIATVEHLALTVQADT